MTADEDAPIGAGETLARYILEKDRIRGRSTSEPSVKPGAFIPRPHLELSVTCHKGLTEAEIWQLGQDVAEKRTEREGRVRTLYGRADIQCATIGEIARKYEAAARLTAVLSEPPRNHVNIVGWPADAQMQDVIAQELAASAKYRPNEFKQDP